MGQQQSSSFESIPLPTPCPNLQHEGILRLQGVPFKDSIQYAPNQFLQHIDTTLASLLQPRLCTMKLFPYQDIQQLIQSLTFALAYAQSKAILYKDISSQYVFYDDGRFKLLPNQLIQKSTYQKLCSAANTYASPQLIIALRYGQKTVVDLEILEKSCVFALGMLLMETATMLPSLQCYDRETNDILDDVISERITLVQEFYDAKIAKIIANMLDYDYSERMNLKELAVWVNREFNCIGKSQNKSQTQLSRVKQRNNSVYMQTKEEDHYQDKNKVYLNQNQNKNKNLMQEYGQNKNKSSIMKGNPYLIKTKDTQISKNSLYSKDSYENNCQGESMYLKNELHRVPTRNIQNKENGRKSYIKQDSVGSFHEKEQNNRRRTFYKSRQQKGGIYLRKYQAQEESFIKKNTDHYFQDKGFNAYIQRDLRNNKFKKPYEINSNLKDKIEPLKERNSICVERKRIKEPFDTEQQGCQTAKIVRQNKIMNRLSEQGFQQKSITRKKQETSQNRSISRIKQQIEKSRRLIQQFRKNEGLKY